MPDFAIEVENLYVDFDSVTAVSGASFSVEKGHIFGLVGPNGAGKTTTLRVLSTLQEPTLGKIKIQGLPLAQNIQNIRHMIGFMPDFTPTYEELKVWECMDLYAAAYQLPADTRKQRCEEELDRVGLSEKRNAFVGELSRGMKQRLTLANTLLHDPQLLLLDEPASGLDPLARKQLYDILQSLQQRGRTVVISSHILAELDKFCTAIGIMEKGRFISSGTLQEMAPKTGALRLRIRLATSDPKSQQKLQAFSAVQTATPGKAKDWEVVLNGDDATAAAYNKFLVESGLAVAELSHIKTSIEDIFLQSGAKDVS